MSCPVTCTIFFELVGPAMLSSGGAYGGPTLISISVLYREEREKSGRCETGVIPNRYEVRNPQTEDGSGVF